MTLSNADLKFVQDVPADDVVRTLAFRKADFYWEASVEYLYLDRMQPAKKDATTNSATAAEESPALCTEADTT
jgi:hypothetical protein